MPLHFKLISLGGQKFFGDVYQVILPTRDGQIGVMPGHMPLVSVAAPGVVAVRETERQPDDLRQFFAISGGLIDISAGLFLLLADEADAAEEISEAEAQAALALARKLKAEARDQVSLDHAQSLIDRSAIRLHVAGLKRRRRG